MLLKRLFNSCHPKLRNHGKSIRNWSKSQDTPKYGGITIVNFHLTDINTLEILKTSATLKALLKEPNALSLTTKFKKLQIKSAAYRNLWVRSRNISSLQSKLFSMKNVHVLSLKIFEKLYTILLILLRCMKLIFMF